MLSVKTDEGYFHYPHMIIDGKFQEFRIDVIADSMSYSASISLAKDLIKGIKDNRK